MAFCLATFCPGYFLASRVLNVEVMGTRVTFRHHNQVGVVTGSKGLTEKHGHTDIIEKHTHTHRERETEREREITRSEKDF